MDYYCHMNNQILSILWDAFIDSIKMLPIIFICYIVIELLEDKILNQYQKNKLLKGKFAPIVSAGFGLIPQCGFSVVATDLYSKGAITLGSLFAIYIATSDEALPILLSNSQNYLNIILIVAIKFVFAIVVGLTIDFIFKSKQNEPLQTNSLTSKKDTKLKKGDKNLTTSKVFCDTKDDYQTIASDISKDDIHGCCHHHIEKNHKSIREIFVHPLLHSLKIFAFILIFNIIFGLVIHLVGEDVFTSFMLSTGIFQPFLVALVGLIPNCASSVLITELFIKGSITLGSTLAGLSVNSGIAIIMLFKLNKNTKQNFAILFSLYLLGVLLGVLVNLVL